MDKHPAITTARLLLRQACIVDTPDIQRLAGEKDIASTTALIPHPYPDGAAEAWIHDCAHAFLEGRRVDFLMESRATGELVGAIGLGIEKTHRRAEMGYWVGKPFWNRGYATEAAEAVLKYGFECLDLHCVFAEHLTRNPASGRVMQKVGMNHEGILRGRVLKWGVWEDMAVYGIINPAHGRDVRD